MNPSEYQKLAERTECNQNRALARMQVMDTLLPNPSTTTIRLNHSIVGLAGEVGELASLLQKLIYYGKWDGAGKEELVQKLADEFGDCLWYIAEGLNALGLDMGVVMKANIAKLKVRYPHSYTDYHTDDENRNREAEENAVISEISSAGG